MKRSISSSQSKSSSALRDKPYKLLTSVIVLLSLAGCSDSGVVVQGENSVGASESGIDQNGSTNPPANDSPSSDNNSGQNPSPLLSLSQLGERIFSDTNLSSPKGQSCSSCHTPGKGFVDPDVDQPSSLGANGGNFGTRNSSTLFYANQIPEFQIVERPHPLTQIPRDVEFGGFFVDGRARTLKEQAKEPFFNEKEMALPSKRELAIRLESGEYSEEFQARFGQTIFQNPELALDAAASALAAFQNEQKFSPFSSKFDRVKNGDSVFTSAESRGEALFTGRALCSVCHTSPSGAEIFSDFLYHNVGAPRNLTLLNNIGDQSFVDLGLGSKTGNPANNGQFRTPTLRNVAKTAPYMHNGVFKNLREVVEFYNSGAEPPEVPGNNIPPFIGNLFLSETDVNDIVAFLHTLTDK